MLNKLSFFSDFCVSPINFKFLLLDIFVTPTNCGIEWAIALSLWGG
ncbi:hypothetical protein [Nostoc sp.]